MAKILDILKAEDLFSEVSLKVLSGYMHKYQKRAFEAILECHLIEEEVLADLIAKAMGIDRIYDLNDHPVDPKVVTLIPWRFALRQNCIAISYSGNKDAIEVVFSDPTREGIIEQVESITHKRVIAAIAEESAIRKKISRSYPAAIQLGL